MVHYVSVDPKASKSMVIHVFCGSKVYTSMVESTLGALRAL